MLKAKLYTTKGEKKGEVALPKDLDVSYDAKIVLQAASVFEDRTHPGLSKVKTRSMIARTTKKWYKQKGTGGARHGARSAPIFVGGGVAHGPKGIKRTLSISKKLKQLAFKSVFSKAVKDEKIVLVEGFSKIKKTKEAFSAIKILIDIVKKGKKILVVLSGDNKQIERYFKNIKLVHTVCFDNLSFSDIYFSSIIFIDSAVFVKSAAVKKTKETK